MEGLCSLTENKPPTTYWKNPNKMNFGFIGFWKGKFSGQCKADAAAQRPQPCPCKGRGQHMIVLVHPGSSVSELCQCTPVSARVWALPLAYTDITQKPFFLEEKKPTLCLELNLLPWFTIHGPSVGLVLAGMITQASAPKTGSSCLQS